MNLFGELIGESPGIVKIREQAERLLKRQSAAGRLPGILIQGETGTGKGLLALLLHRASARARGPFVQLNCAAIPDNLVETELFGNVKGAYTDAREAKPGLFQAADHGTLFLDEIGSLRKDHQAKLLTAIEDRVVRRVGATRTEAVDVWVLAACNSDLAAAAHEGEFREDLYYRLAGVTLTLPPLRERGRDVLLLAEHFLERTCAEHKLGTRTLADDARAALLAYRWKGNVRQLAGKIESAATFSDESVVTADMLDLADSESLGVTPTEALVQEERAFSHEEAMGEVERERLLAALRQTNWNVTHAAERLGMSRDTLRGRMKKYDLRPDGSSPVARRASCAQDPPRRFRPPALSPCGGNPAASRCCGPFSSTRPEPIPRSVVAAPSKPSWRRLRASGGGWRRQVRRASWEPLGWSPSRTLRVEPPMPPWLSRRPPSGLPARRTSSCPSNSRFTGISSSSVREAVPRSSIWTESAKRGRRSKPCFPAFSPGRSSSTRASSRSSPVTLTSCRSIRRSRVISGRIGWWRRKPHRPSSLGSRRSSGDTTSSTYFATGWPRPRAGTGKWWASWVRPASESPASSMNSAKASETKGSPTGRDTASRSGARCRICLCWTSLGKTSASPSWMDPRPSPRRCGSGCSTWRWIRSSGRRTSSTSSASRRARSVWPD